MAHQGKWAKFLHVSAFFQPMEKLAWNGPKWGRERFFPINPDLADIFGRTDLNFENFNIFVVLIPNFWISRSPDFQIPRPRTLGPDPTKIWGHFSGGKESTCGNVVRRVGLPKNMGGNCSEERNPCGKVVRRVGLPNMRGQFF